MVLHLCDRIEVWLHHASLVKKNHDLVQIWVSCGAYGLVADLNFIVGAGGH